MVTKAKPKSRVSGSATKKGGFKFRWWMAAVLVVAVAVVGLAVLRFSHAFGGGKIYIYQEGSGPYVEYDFNIDSSVNLKESITGSERKNVPFTQAQAVGLQMVQDALRKTGQADVADQINPSNLPPQITGQIESANQQGKATTAQQQAQQSTSSTTTPQSSATTTTTNSTTSTTTVTPSEAPPPKTYPVAGVVDFRLPSSIANNAASVTYSLDGQKIETVTKSPYNIQFNSTKYENGSHLLQVSVVQKNSFNKTYVYALEIQNPTDWWHKFTQGLNNVFGGN